MSALRPLSDITESLQTLAKSKHDNSLFTGSEFVDAYGEPGQPLDSEPNKTIATAGGDLQNAYSKLHSVYMRAKNANEDNRNEFKITGEAEQSLNTEALVGDLGFALEHLASAAGKLREHEPTLAAEIDNLASHVKAHQSRISGTGVVVLR